MKLQQLFLFQFLKLLKISLIISSILSALALISYFLVGYYLQDFTIDIVSILGIGIFFIGYNVATYFEFLLRNQYTRKQLFFSTLLVAIAMIMTMSILVVVSGFLLKNLGIRIYVDGAVYHHTYIFSGVVILVFEAFLIAMVSILMGSLYVKFGNYLFYTLLIISFGIGFIGSEVNYHEVLLKWMIILFDIQHGVMNAIHMTVFLVGMNALLIAIYYIINRKLLIR
ncbi:hypothetical protein H1220_07520 [Carnobacteriaceae bacterium zg-84]|uniref:hypothetical protein n=1 Tax=Granulicatella sp. zg-84 TaxID=2678503 RepID=UPI0013BEF6A6|nr:hypothetical protein [Granulicatella sp. zg-84]NEW65589.1 hypothetical protein [Granulicatella sp. zg-84]QMI85532.1 hypothetical protein H1220_07520 [Carnobacteriaceae bacterium zg-84]